jgi:hypothetical protein
MKFQLPRILLTFFFFSITIAECTNAVIGFNAAEDVFPTVLRLQADSNRQHLSKKIRALRLFLIQCRGGVDASACSVIPVI